MGEVHIERQRVGAFDQWVIHTSSWVSGYSPLPSNLDRKQVDAIGHARSAASTKMSCLRCWVWLSVAHEMYNRVLYFKYVIGRLGVKDLERARGLGEDNKGYAGDGRGAF